MVDGSIARLKTLDFGNLSLPSTCHSIQPPSPARRSHMRIPSVRSSPIHLRRHTGADAPADAFAAIFRRCAASGAAMEGRKLHAHMIVAGLLGDPFVENHMINMYGKCGLLDDAHWVFRLMGRKNLHSWNTLIDSYCKFGSLCQARRLFEEMPVRDSVSWNTMISGYDRRGPYECALDVFIRMRGSDCAIDHFGLSSVISACGNMRSLVSGLELHGLSLKIGLDRHVQVGGALIGVYAACGVVVDARRVFDEMPVREQSTWNSMLSGYVKCSRIDEALLFFSEMPEKNVVSYTTVISGSSQSGRYLKAMDLFLEMRNVGMVPDMKFFVSILSACVKELDFAGGLKIHSHIVKLGLKANSAIGSVLVGLYAKFGYFGSAANVVGSLDYVDDFSWSILIAEYCRHGLVDSALELFESLEAKSLPLWNAMIGGYSELELDGEAIKAFKNMQLVGTRGDEFTFGPLLTCAKVSPRRCGQQLHSQTIKLGVDTSFFIVSALIKMYSNALDCEDALRVFKVVPEPNLIVYNTMISGYVQNNKHLEAIHMMRLIMSLGMKRDNVTCSLVLVSCSRLLSLMFGSQVQALAYKLGYESDVVVGTSLIEMYSECDALDAACGAFSDIHNHNVFSWTALLGCYVKCEMWTEANDLFAKMPELNVVSWNTMISGHAKQCHGSEVLHFYSQLCRAGQVPDRITFVNALMACTKCSFHEPGEQIHAHIIKNAFFLDGHVSIALNDFYQGKLGSNQLRHGCLSAQLIEEMEQLDRQMLVEITQNHAQVEALVPSS